jgi:hypothetical protein
LTGSTRIHSQFGTADPGSTPSLGIWTGQHCTGEEAG